MPNEKLDSVPDTATTYERAKPSEESPGGKLTEPPARKAENADSLKDNASPSEKKPLAKGV